MLKRRPPLTTFETRLTFTTVSSRFSFEASILGIFSPSSALFREREFFASRKGRPKTSSLFHGRLRRARPHVHDRDSRRDQRPPARSLSLSRAEPPACRPRERGRPCGCSRWPPAPLRGSSSRLSERRGEPFWSVPAGDLSPAPS